MGSIINQEVEEKIFRNLLNSYKDVFVWTHHDLTTGITLEHGEHKIEGECKTGLSQVVSTQSKVFLEVEG